MKKSAADLKALVVPKPMRMPKNLPGIDGLRAIAVAAVVLYHVIPGAVPGGGLGVDMFFVISGFLITGLLFTEHADTGRIRLRSFWARRARRLVPALVLLVVVCATIALVAAIAGNGGDLLVGIGPQVLGAATFSSNWLAIATGASYFAQSTPELFRNLWSLSVEEQFYLVWPFVVVLALFIRRPAVRLVIFMLIAITSAGAMALLYSPNIDSTRVYYGTDTHSFGLALGAALAILTSRMPWTELEWARWARRLLPIPGILALGGLIALAILLPAESAMTFRGGLALVAVLTAVTIWGAIIPGSFLGRALDLAPLRWIGKRSYGIYLWHWPVILILVALEPGWQNSPATLWLGGALDVAITVAVAALSYRFVERPIRSEGFRPWVRRRFGAGSSTRVLRGLRVTIAVLSTLLLVAGIGTMAVAISRAPQHGQAASVIDSGKIALARERFLPPPPPGSPGTKIDAVGDSVMLAASPELEHTFPGIAINALVSRQMNKLPGIVKALADRGRLRDTLVVGLGTNGFIARSTLDQVRGILGPSRQLVLVNTQVPRVWENSVNGILKQYAADYDNVELADWHSAISSKISILAPDHIHPGPTGGRIYAGAIKAALLRLAERPPYPTLAVLQARSVPAGD
jgi:peptidoglycan/LPS O-acetylase OafA/YrhL